MSVEGEYKLELRADGATLSGVMRLVSPAAYRSALAAVHDQIEAAKGPLELDLAGLQFLNSSGITALSRLVMLAREHSVQLTVIIDEQVSWQKKTLPSLARLYPKLTLKAR
ncbi:STAS domain-containing protein [Myxococcota bacterium]|nr:STAS domain-containing protein [Myxococcota bacterium]